MRAHYLNNDDVFSEWELKEIPPFVKEFWTNYSYGCYDGSGQLLMLTEDGLWHLHDCSHCSCYGPTDRIYTALVSEPGTGATLDSIVADLSVGYREELQPLLDAIGWKGSVL